MTPVPRRVGVEGPNLLERVRLLGDVHLAEGWNDVGTIELELNVTLALDNKLKGLEKRVDTLLGRDPADEDEAPPSAFRNAARIHRRIEARVDGVVDRMAAVGNLWETDPDAVRDEFAATHDRMAATGQEIVSPEFLRAHRPDLVIAMNPIYVDEIGQELARLGVDARVLAV